MNCDLINAYQKIDKLKTYGIDCSFSKKYGEEIMDELVQEGLNYMNSINANTDSCTYDKCVRYYNTQPYSCFNTISTSTPNNITLQYFAEFFFDYNKILVGSTQTDEYVVAMRLKSNWTNSLVTPATILIKSITVEFKDLSSGYLYVTTMGNHTWAYSNTDVNDGKKIYDLLFRFYDAAPGYIQNGQYECKYTITIWDGVNQAQTIYTHTFDTEDYS